MKVEFSKQAYSATALQKAAYEVAADLSVSIADEGSNYIVTAQPVHAGKPDVDLTAFLRTANDYALREKLAVQTEPLRNLVLAHAYSKTPFVQE